MAESVDALVSNTSGATHPGSIPGLGTESEKVERLSPTFLYSPTQQANDNIQEREDAPFRSTLSYNSSKKYLFAISP